MGETKGYHESKLKPRIITKIIEEKQNEELDDSDLMEEFHKMYSLDQPHHIKSKLSSYDIDKLIEIMNKLYSDVIPHLNRVLSFRQRPLLAIKKSIDKLRVVFEGDLELGSKSTEELTDDAITIIRKLIYLNKEINPEYKLSDVVSDLGNIEYEMALKEGDELVNDPYGNLVIDYSKKQTTNPLQYPTSVQELLKGRKVIGQRDGVQVHDDFIRYKQPSYEGGGKKSRRKTIRKKIGKRKKRTMKKKK